ncbi:AlbA family DNA-binding domain-containing protein [Tundrisphaera lichenicola]|uniref:AlbA family DNA-binding domain-containing protein n=1 Tax=Tundrisphaera lichenicola TaxID=2029860 RepID=UPI003EBBBE6C
MPYARSTAREYFDFIKTHDDPFEYLSSIPDSSAPHYPFFEEEWIDFKGDPQDDNDAKKIWSKALSGFANITDGLIVWGVDARKTQPRGIDAACGLRLISDPPVLESKLRDWVRDATNPPVMGVEFFSIIGPGGGFVVCFVPESGYKPHRAEWAGKHYHYRASDDFLMAEPGLLRTLFYPQAHPQLRIEVDLSFELLPKDLVESYRRNPNSEMFNKLLNDGEAALRYEARLRNDGTASAKDVYVVIQTQDNLDFSTTPLSDTNGTPGRFVCRV